VLLVTHEPRVAGYADRDIALRDGVLDPGGVGGVGRARTAAGAA
jgi:putative ABC transport system ATP-binding protein